MNIYSITDIGMERENNQDACINYFHSKFALLVVADGMGGYEGGEIASAMTVEAVQDFIIENKHREDYKKMLGQAIEEANRQVHKKAMDNDEIKSMGTTIVAATVEGNQVTIAHVGDSRCYLWREGTLNQITRDHSLVADLVRKGVLTQEDAKTHPDRSAVTRAIGISDEVEIDFDELELEKGDKLLLCSDGLSNMLEEEEIAQVIKPGGATKGECERLVALANKAGGFDNITVTLYEYEG